MREKNFGHAIEITAKQEFTVEQLFELLKREGNFETAPTVRTQFGISAIFFPGAGGFENVIGVRCRKISIQQAKTSAKGALKSLLIDWLTDNWSFLFNMEGKKNAPVMAAIAKEIERLAC